MGGIVTIKWSGPKSGEPASASAFSFGFRDCLVALEWLLTDAGYKSNKLKTVYTSNWLAKTAHGVADIGGGKNP
jgi:hypothetical protein